MLGSKLTAPKPACAFGKPPPAWSPGLTQARRNLTVNERGRRKEVSQRGLETGHTSTFARSREPKPNAACGSLTHEKPQAVSPVALVGVGCILSSAPERIMETRLLYQAATWKVTRRLVAHVEHHAGSCFRVGFTVVNLNRPAAR
jgi:hypothetical protein